MKCEKCMASYLLLDNGQKPSLSIRVHLLLCEKCKREVAELASHFETIKSMEPPFTYRGVEESVMQIIRHSPVTRAKKVSVVTWVFAELLILASIVLVQFSPAKIWLDAVIGNTHHIILSATLGILITIFSALLIMTHIDALNDFKRRLLTKIR